MPGATQTYFSQDRQPTKRRGPDHQTLLREAIEAETGKDMAEFFKVLVRKALGEEGAPYMKMLMDRISPTLKAHMRTVTIDHFPVNGTATEQAEAVLTAVAQGTLPLDYAGPMLTMIQIIDTAKGGSLGNSGLDLSALYAGTDNGLANAASFARSIAARQPKPEVIDITPAAPAQQHITEAISAEADAIISSLESGVDQEAAQKMADDASARLAAQYPASTLQAINEELVKVLNERVK